MIHVFTNIIEPAPLQCDHTPLMTACEYKKTDVVKYLLDLNVTEVAAERQRTALHIASAHNATDIVGLLIDKGFPLSVQDKNVRYPSIWSCRIPYD